ncbi:TetR/AcrR family transcriptional regulator C-terminal domain-containing protein [Streptomyces solicathayae]|uniref:TetR/AcrR family transcriptional regulator C-terminal domain-containing protein n=1 Tax=Streptomyces solicathayae TaxID=3081768 RepID=A0ABZ0LZ82_9ACTN|nr:TetR/AcrR family transcriptional regulator C-terminal domain-containing protein [Streptomyces sp. HUAS YS2]WOX24736.1 TetR/AcrR family transcriptional regulator C-terminal domain-containing protein [Streptomyces sp. HUAS YS2]
MGRPRKALLDRERITSTALELVDAQGEFSVPQIARKLGVQTASVYHHVDGRDGIVELVRERVCAAIDPATLRLEGWDEAMTAWARSYRAAFAAHPRAIPLLTTSPVRAPMVLLQYEQAVTRLLDAGFALPDVMPVIIGLENLVLGSALDMAAPEAMWELTDEAETPQLARALGVTDTRSEAAFELALTGYVAYLRTLLEADDPA